eukprot:TRINITY_DN4073_c0_g1_i1.p1 TRINITY_DN4073_c0_g1~~TRINITY_DN4073_c0_g1_i1.p1  ORF type:complete len:201 (-),score=13.10 TRINITY_DN4073_c0_g1_i1:41-616(-)
MSSGKLISLLVLLGCLLAVSQGQYFLVDWFTDSKCTQNNYFEQALTNNTCFPSAFGASNIFNTTNNILQYYDCPTTQDCSNCSLIANLTIGGCSLASNGYYLLTSASPVFPLPKITGYQKYVYESSTTCNGTATSAQYWPTCYISSLLTSCNSTTAIFKQCSSNCQHCSNDTVAIPVNLCNNGRKVGCNLA